MRVEVAVIAALLSSSVMARAYPNSPPRGKPPAILTRTLIRNIVHWKTTKITIKQKPMTSTVTETVTVTASAPAADDTGDDTDDAADDDKTDDDKADDDKTDDDNADDDKTDDDKADDDKADDDKADDDKTDDDKADDDNTDDDKSDDDKSDDDKTDDDKTDDDKTDDDKADDAKPAAAPKTITVKATMLNGKPAFDPSTVTAAVGDKISFRFEAGMTHSVVRGDFKKPCQPASNAFYSGMVSNKPGGWSTFTVDVTDTKPIWFYCSYGMHCQHGMVGVVNAADDQTLDDYTTACEGAAKNVSPTKAGGGKMAAVL
ncbi:Helicase [Dactylellina cionopaga]|nr:Helicase [Dactylellina cionopaga]